MDNILGVKRYLDNTEPGVVITLHISRDNYEMIQQFSPRLALGHSENRFSLTKNSNRDTNGALGRQCWVINDRIM